MGVLPNSELAQTFRKAGMNWVSGQCPDPKGRMAKQDVVAGLCFLARSADACTTLEAGHSPQMFQSKFIFYAI
jgi:hypothetical protein